MDTWAPRRGETTVSAVMTALQPWLSAADGVTISGGEPFEQPEALLALLKEVRRAFDGDVLVYSGYELVEIASTLARADGLIDALITGRFEQSLPQNLPLRGSDNQELHLLMPLGQARFACIEQEQKKKLDVMFDADGSVWFAGVPARNDMARLAALLAADGSRVSTSADKRKNEPERVRKARGGER